MKLSNSLIKLPQISQAMREMSMEMTKVRNADTFICFVGSLIIRQAGILEEMLEDTLDMDEDEEIEDEADAEVDKVLYELTEGKLGLASTTAGLPVSLHRCCAKHTLSFRLQVLEDQLEDEETERNMEKYRQQLNGLLSG